MHVGLNLVYLVPGEQGGLEIYARELLRALPVARPDLRLTAFVNREARAAGGEWDEVADVVEVPVFARNRVEWVRGEQQLLPGLARRAGVDVVHSLASTAPARGRFARVVTIHDLNYRAVPDAHFGLLGLGMRVLVPLAAHRSHRVIAISRSTARDVERHLHVSASRIDVVPQGVGVTPRADPVPSDDLRERHARLLRVDVAFNFATIPGRSVGDAVAAGIAAYAEHGFDPGEWRLHHQGGPTGYEARDYAADAESAAAIVDGQAFAWNPSVPSLKSEDTVLVRAAAPPEVLTVDDRWPTADVAGVRRPLVLER